MAKLQKQDVLHLAQLARLQLSDQEISQFQEEISDILSYMEQLQAVPLDGVEPTSQVTGLKNVTRPDEIKKLPYTNAELLKNTPELDKNNYIKVKRVLS